MKPFFSRFLIQMRPISILDENVRKYFTITHHFDGFLLGPGTGLSSVRLLDLALLLPEVLSADGGVDDVALNQLQLPVVVFQGTALGLNQLVGERHGGLNLLNQSGHIFELLFVQILEVFGLLNKLAPLREQLVVEPLDVSFQLFLDILAPEHGFESRPGLDLFVPISIMIRKGYP